MHHESVIEIQSRPDRTRARPPAKGTRPAHDRTVWIAPARTGTPARPKPHTLAAFIRLSTCQRTRLLRRLTIAGSATYSPPTALVSAIEGGEIIPSHSRLSSPVLKEFSFPAHTSSTCRKCTSDLHRPVPINRLTSAITGTRPEAAAASPASFMSIRDHDRDDGFCVRRPRLTTPGRLASRFERPNLLDPNCTPRVSRGSLFFSAPRHTCGRSRVDLRDTPVPRNGSVAREVFSAWPARVATTSGNCLPR